MMTSYSVFLPQSTMFRNWQDLTMSPNFCTQTFTPASWPEQEREKVQYTVVFLLLTQQKRLTFVVCFEQIFIEICFCTQKSFSMTSWWEKCLIVPCSLVTEYFFRKRKEHVFLWSVGHILPFFTIIPLPTKQSSHQRKPQVWIQPVWSPILFCMAVWKPLSRCSTPGMQPFKIALQAAAAIQRLFCLI